MKLKHYDHDGRARFVTFVIHRRIPLLTNDPVRQIVADCIDRMRQMYSFRLIAYVIMPEHVHLVISPAEKTLICLLIGEIKRLSARQIHRIFVENEADVLRRLTVVQSGRLRFTLWQRRCYDHNCRTEESVWKKVEYCHYNPVSRGLVREPADWLWSSYRWYQSRRDVPLTIDFSLE